MGISVKWVWSYKQPFTSVISTFHIPLHSPFHFTFLFSHDTYYLCTLHNQLTKLRSIDRNVQLCVYYTACISSISIKLSLLSIYTLGQMMSCKCHTYLDTECFIFVDAEVVDVYLSSAVTAANTVAQYGDQTMSLTTLFKSNENIGSLLRDEHHSKITVDVHVQHLVQDRAHLIPNLTQEQNQRGYRPLVS